MTSTKVFPLAELAPDAAKRVVLDGIPIAVVLDSAGVAAVARGQFVRTGERPGEPYGDGPIRVRDGAGTLVAIARYQEGRLAPDKVLVDAPTPVPARA